MKKSSSVVSAMKVCDVIVDKAKRDGDLTGIDFYLWEDKLRARIMAISLGLSRKDAQLFMHSIPEIVVKIYKEGGGKCRT
jgi:hypothetical protein